MPRASFAYVGTITTDYDLCYISTLELLRAEEIWIENQRRPKPHPRDVALTKRVNPARSIGVASGPRSGFSNRRP
jgi:hypothetical protein